MLNHPLHHPTTTLLDPTRENQFLEYHPRRHILIPVDIPEIQVMHTAELQLHNLATDPTHASVGQMIEGELHLRHTRRWCSPAQRENNPGGGPLEFSYEIHANPDQKVDIKSHVAIEPAYFHQWIRACGLLGDHAAMLQLLRHICEDNTIDIFHDPSQPYSRVSSWQQALPRSDSRWPEQLGNLG